jgi:hypothetical protein
MIDCTASTTIVTWMDKTTASTLRRAPTCGNNHFHVA